jgi:uncharacterized membrane protein YkoI
MIIQKPTGVIVLIAGVLLCGTVYGAEESITLEDLPSAVRTAAEAQSAGATVRGYSREVEDGMTHYEMELALNGRTRDVIFSADGSVVAVENEVTLAEVPEAAQSAIEAAVGSGQLESVETITENGTMSYEAIVSRNGTESEVKVNAKGEPVD